METSARYTIIGLFTLGVVAAGLAFVYWLHTSGGFAAQASYRVRFERSAGGLLVGSAVQFNGIKVGQVVSLTLDPADPRRVEATIGVDPKVPVRADTQVTIEGQGLTGAAVVSLTGGDPAAARLATGDVLVADARAAQSINQSAREVLQRIDGILTDNEEPLHKLIGNLETFAGALSRNSERVDGILAGLERMTGGAAKGPAAVFDLGVPQIAPITDAAKLPAGVLAVPEPSAPMALNSDKMMVRGPDGDLKPAAGAQWADAVPVLLQTRLVQAFENAGAGTAVMRPSDSVQPTWRLLLDVRAFTADTGPAQAATIELSARIVAEAGAIVAVHNVKRTAPLTGADAAAVARALDTAFSDVAMDLVPWALQATAPKAQPSAVEPRGAPTGVNSPRLRP